MTISQFKLVSLAEDINNKEEQVVLSCNFKFSEEMERLLSRFITSFHMDSREEAICFLAQYGLMANKEKIDLYFKD